MKFEIVTVRYEREIESVVRAGARDIIAAARGTALAVGKVVFSVAHNVHSKLRKTVLLFIVQPGSVSSSDPVLSIGAHADATGRRVPTTSETVRSSLPMVTGRLGGPREKAAA